jgi:uncharacterized protein YbcC (UPF0753/DUF2309 family)
MDLKHSKLNSPGWEGLEKLVHDLKHYLPSQAPLKDFIHHNSLHAFQQKPFFQGIKEATDIFGYRTTLGLSEYRMMFDQGRISPEILEKVVNHYALSGSSVNWKERMLNGEYKEDNAPRIGKLRAHWHQVYNLDLETFVQPVLFRILCSYLDQGISIWDFPVSDKGFLASIREMEETSYSSFFKSKLARQLLQQEELTIEDLLDRIVGDTSLYSHYIFDQQFSHQGWSGMVSVVEDLPQSLLISRKISLPDLIIFELLLELDTLEDRLPGKWKPLSQSLESEVDDLFAKEPLQELDKIRELWQRAFEWSLYDQVIAGFALTRNREVMQKSRASFQAVLCIDDRECSYRRYLERFDPECETFGTPGFFGIEFYFQPKGGKFFTKVCPAPVTPKFLIKEIGVKTRLKKDITFSKQSHSFVFGWFISQTIGFWSALKLFFNIFRPTMGPATASSLKHMDRHAKLLVENRNPAHIESGLQVGFNVDEMAVRVGNMLKSIGLVRDFAPIVYIIGHGASSVNNPHYAAYDCGACSGRAGSVNARAFSYMANHVQVRAILRERGIDIPDETQFIGAIRDTTRDEIVWFDLETLYPDNKDRHIKNQDVFYKSLDFNAKERSRRFNSINSGLSPASIHEKILTRSVSLFEPRPELNHATNALCIVGRRSLSKGLFLDRRSFLNSYDYREDPEGNYLLNILNAAAPVCGGINLEYYFSRVDNQKLGAGTKLPHNVMGLFGVANGIDGDLRPGLPSQMIEMHDPVRLLMVVEHFPDIVLNTIRRNSATFEWFENEWVVLVAIDPETGISHYYENGGFSAYQPIQKSLDVVENVDQLLESTEENFPVLIIAQKN